APTGTFVWFTTLGQVFTATYGSPAGPATPITGYYGVDYRLVLQLAVQMGLPGAPAAYDSLRRQIAMDGHVRRSDSTLVSDLGNRAGSALATAPSSSPTISIPRQAK